MEASGISYVVFVLSLRGLLLFSCSVVSDSATPWAVACQAPLSMGFPRKECWNVLSFPSPEDPPNPGTDLVSPALAGRFFTTEPLGKPSLRGQEQSYKNSTLLSSVVSRLGTGKLALTLEIKTSRMQVWTQAWQSGGARFRIEPRGTLLKFVRYL